MKFLKLISTVDRLLNSKLSYIPNINVLRGSNETAQLVGQIMDLSGCNIYLCIVVITLKSVNNSKLNIFSITKIMFICEITLWKDSNAEHAHSKLCKKY